MKRARGTHGADGLVVFAEMQAESHHSLRVLVRSPTIYPEP